MMGVLTCPSRAFPDAALISTGFSALIGYAVVPNFPQTSSSINETGKGIVDVLAPC